MSAPRIKICGITNAEDAHHAVAAGADALGFVFHPPSPRAVEPDQVAEIVAGLPPFVSGVGLFVNTPAAEIIETMRKARLQVVQVHGEAVDLFGLNVVYPVIRALAVKDASSLAGIEERGLAALLLDAWHERLYGGSGQSFDWQLVRRLRLTRPLILAGGLTPHNVAAAIREVQPYAVDVSSGVERQPGHKDPDKVTQFIQQVKQS